MLNGKTIIITGAGSGIGRAAATLFAEAGARLLLADWNEASVEQTADMVRSAGGEPEDVAYVARFLLSDQAAFMNAAAIAVDGGYTAR